MCGLSGLIVTEKTGCGEIPLKHDVAEMLTLSRARGQDASGAAFQSGSQLRIEQRNGSVLQLIKSAAYKNGITEILNAESAGFTFIGQSRLATSFIRGADSNNQPVFSKDTVLIHNGVVTALGGEEIPISTECSDTVKTLEYIDKKTTELGDTLKAVQDFFANMNGSATLGILKPKTNRLLLATNTGSLYYFYKPGKYFGFLSEEFLAKEFLKNSRLFNLQDLNLFHLAPGQALELDTEKCELIHFEIQKAPHFTSLNEKILEIKVDKPLVQLKRCSCCILPSTYPFIEFDSAGVCNFCRRYSAQVLRGEQEFEKILDSVRSKDGSPDCLVGLSGGRDSSYGLHLLKIRFGMNPIAYTFDWGLTTEVSRSNQARLCGQLGVEHIIRSADLQQKRKYINSNVQAFLKRPHLGMVPLFMAGDKEFYQLGRKLRDQNALPLTVFCSGHSLEQRDFMTGFCGVDENIAGNKRLYAFDFASKLKLSLFYASQYIKNPAYINSSLADSVKSFFYSFVFKDDFLYLYEYIPWNEGEMERTLKETYAWEPDKNYGSNQWRMGDGQTAFTNYIYYSVAGFSEYDNFRSNQIREGLISRDEALKLVEYDNQPKTEMLKYFAEVVGLDLAAVLKRIDAIPKLY